MRGVFFTSFCFFILILGQSYSETMTSDTVSSVSDLKNEITLRVYENEQYENGQETLLAGYPQLPCACKLGSCKCVPGAAANNNCMNGQARIRCGCGGAGCSCPVSTTCAFNNVTPKPDPAVCTSDIAPDGKGCYLQSGCTGRGRKGCGCASRCVISTSCGGKKSCNCDGYECSSKICVDVCKRSEVRCNGEKDSKCASCVITKNCAINTHDMVEYGSGWSVFIYVAGIEYYKGTQACEKEYCNGVGASGNFCQDGGCGGCSKFPCNCGDHFSEQIVKKGNTFKATVVSGRVCNCQAPVGFCKCQ